MEYTLKDKLMINNEFISDLEAKSWQEIEHLQRQIANIDTSENNLKVIQLLKNLLTSYYVFVGGLENLNSEITTNTYIDEKPVQADTEKVIGGEADCDEPRDDFIFEPLDAEKQSEEIEPFEYFVDFDDPVGEPISDKDLYGN